MKRGRKVSIICILIITFNLIINGKMTLAIENEHRFRRITIEEGLSQASVEAILQDSKGYMWFGTSDGLNRYDGHNFKVYKYNLKDENSLISNYVDALVEDENGVLWVGTSKGLNKLDPSTDKITRYTDDHNDHSSISHYNVWAITIDKRGQKWIGTEDGLNRYDDNTDTFIKYYHEEKDDSSLSNSFITTICDGEDGEVWIGTKAGLNKYDSKTNKFTRYNHLDSDKNSLSCDEIKKIYKDSVGDIWIGTDDGGLNKYNKDKNNFTIFKSDGLKNELQSNCVKSIFEDSRGEIWIGTDFGLSRFNKETKSFNNYSNSDYNQESLIDNNVLSIYEDKTGMLWFGTYRGISLFNPSGKFNNYRKNPGNNKLINDNTINGIFEDDEGIVWIGTDKGGLNALNRLNNNVEYYLNNKNDTNTISDDTVRHIAEDKDGELWIATKMGLNKYNKKNKQFTRYVNNSENSIISNDVKFVYVDSSGVIWIGTRGGLCSYNKSNDEFTSYNELFKKNGISECYITSILEDEDGVLWIGSAIEGGLIKFDRRDYSIKNYKSYKQNKNTLSNNSIKAIASDSKGNLWIATNYGLNKFNKKSEMVTRYTEEEGLSNNTTYGVLVDKEDNPWVSSNNGISKLKVETGKFINYTTTDGLQSSEFNGYSYFKSKKGEMFFGGINGFNSFFPESIAENQYVPKVIIEKIEIFNKTVSVNDEINLKYNENFFSLEFFLPEFRNANKTKYEYMLEGVDKKWSVCKGRNYASYTNVKDGAYTFKVRACNSNGAWSEPTEMKILVETPPWRSFGAYCLYSLIIVFILFVIWNYVKILETLVKQRTIQLNNKLEENEKLYNKLIIHEKFKNNYFVNLSHELRTPLNVILSTVQLVNKLNKNKELLSKETIHKYINIINRNSNNLLKIINDLIDTSKIEAGSYKIEPKEVDIVYVVEEATLSMKDFIENNGLNLIIDPEIEEKNIECEAVDIERCIINLLSNAVKFTPEGGTIFVSIYDKEDWVEISVRDTGVGIPLDQQEVIFNRFGQAGNSVIGKSYATGSGIGLTLVKSLVEIHGGNIRVTSKPNEGSEFIITLPIRHLQINN